jgi:ubiquitin-protein ligase E3 A
VQLPLPANCMMPGTHSDMCIVRARRNHLLEGALSEVSRQLKRNLLKPLRVHFIGEEGIDAGGVKKEVFQLLATQLLSPDYGMLRHQAESNTYWSEKGQSMAVGSGD